MCIYISFYGELCGRLHRIKLFMCVKLLVRRLWPVWRVTVELWYELVCFGTLTWLEVG